MVLWTIGHNSVELWPGPGFSLSLFPRFPASPWALQVAGICCNVGSGGLEEDPTNPFLQIELWEVRNLQPVFWPAAVQPLLSTLGSESGNLATSWVASSSPKHMPWSTPWAMWLGVQLCVVCGRVPLSCRPGGWGGTRPLCGSPGSCRAPLVILPPWQVVLGHTRGHVVVGVGTLQASHYSSVAPSGHFKKPAKLCWQLWWIAHIIPSSLGGWTAPASVQDSWVSMLQLIPVVIVRALWCASEWSQPSWANSFLWGLLLVQLQLRAAERVM